MSVKANYNVQCTVIETLEIVADGLASDKTITHDAFNSHIALDADTDVPVTKVVSFVETLDAGGDKTIDLYTLTGKGVNGASVSGDTLKVQIFKIKNPVGNEPLIVKFGGATGYLLLGDAWTLILKAGQEFTFYGNNLTPTISDTLKFIDLDGGNDETDIEVLIVMG